MFKCSSYWWCSHLSTDPSCVSSSHESSPSWANEWPGSCDALTWVPSPSRAWPESTDCADGRIWRQDTNRTPSRTCLEECSPSLANRSRSTKQEKCNRRSAGVCTAPTRRPRWWGWAPDSQTASRRSSTSSRAGYCTCCRSWVECPCGSSCSRRRSRCRWTRRSRWWARPSPTRTCPSTRPSTDRPVCKRASRASTWLCIEKWWAGSSICESWETRPLLRWWWSQARQTRLNT